MKLLRRLRAVHLGIFTVVMALLTMATPATADISPQAAIVQGTITSTGIPLLLLLGRGNCVLNLTSLAGVDAGIVQRFTFLGVATGLFHAGSEPLTLFHVGALGTLKITARGAGCDSVLSGTGRLFIGPALCTGPGTIYYDYGGKDFLPDDIGAPTRITCTLAGTYFRLGPVILASLSGLIAIDDPSGTGLPGEPRFYVDTDVVLTVVGLVATTTTGPCAGRGAYPTCALTAAFSGAFAEID